MMNIDGVTIRTIDRTSGLVELFFDRRYQVFFNVDGTIRESRSEVRTGKYGALAWRTARKGLPVFIVRAAVKAFAAK